MRIFRKKQKSMTVSEEKVKADVNRTRSEEIKNTLLAADRIRKQIVGKSNTYPFSRDNLEKYATTIDNLIRTLDNRHASIADTEIIDVMVKDFALRMADDFKQRNTETVSYDLKALQYGITTAKKEIDSGNQEYIQKVMDSRRENLARFHIILDLARQLDEINRSNGRYIEALRNTEKEYEKAKKIMIETFQQNPGLQEELDKLKVGKPVSSEAQELSNQRNDTVQLFNRRNHLRSLIATNHQQYSSCRNNISTMVDQMNGVENLIGEEQTEKMRKFNEQFQLFLNEQQNLINDMQSISNEFHNSMISITSSRKFIDNIIENEERYKKIMSDLEEKEAADERGRKILQEQQVEQGENTYKHENQTIILN